MDKMKFEKEEVRPVCPFCEARLERMIEVKQGWFASNRVYCCPHCRKILGISSMK